MTLIQVKLLTEELQRQQVTDNVLQFNNTKN